jgi:phosphoribosylanthranilate isomerase
VRFNTEGLFIKVSGVTCEEDALFSIGLGASAVGFEFGPTPRKIATSAAHDIVRRLPMGAVSVGVFRNEMPQRIVEISNTLGLSAVQIEGAMTRSSLDYVAERVNTVIRCPPLSQGVLNLDAVSGVDYFLLPEADDVSALADCLAIFQDPSLRTPIIASGGLNSSNVVEIVQNYPVWGVDVRAGVETAPGVKDPVLLGEFIANAKWAYDNAYVAHHHDEWPSA